MARWKEREPLEGRVCQNICASALREGLGTWGPTPQAGRVDEGISRGPVGQCVSSDKVLPKASPSPTHPSLLHICADLAQVPFPWEDFGQSSLRDS